MAGFLKKKLMEDITRNGSFKDGELTMCEMRQVLKRFRLTKKDLYPVCKELESEGFLSMKGKISNIKIKINRKLRL